MEYPTIRQFVNYLNNPEYLGGYWLPNIQRQFVWSEDQIERLFDSIMREYPIGSLLIWKTKSNIKHRRFIDHYKKTISLLDSYVGQNTNPKLLILDGQQRLQSLYIGLKGTYEGKYLYFNLLSGNESFNGEKKYEFKFFTNPPSSNWIKFSNIIFTDKTAGELKYEIKDQGIENDLRLIEKNINIAQRVFCQKGSMIYQQVDSIDRPEHYNDDDIVEIFIRANSGGTKLDKSDLLFSLLISSWDEADKKMFNLLEELNNDGFNFGRDFILKCCLVIFDKGARYEVTKFRDDSIKNAIEEQWFLITDAIKDVKDFIKGKTFIQCDKVLSSYLVLIPLIYFRYHFKNKWKDLSDINNYLLRSLLAGAFSGNPDSLIDKIIKHIKEKCDFNVDEIFSIIRNDGRNLEIDSNIIQNLSYSDKRIHLLFNLWYDFNYTPAYIQNEPQIDHIFPQSVLRGERKIDISTGRQILKYKIEDRDNIGNLMLLTREENGAGGKTDKLPEEWFKDKSEEYLKMHLIPADKDLWKVENYEKFIMERKKLILQKFNYLLNK